ncbi:MAG: hypothetical protein H6779_04685 [Candidatus Nomurabacteria bacterium]|nr:hypothetical protein [Candidatus Nomurabacteria bacterium]USN87670.1 MAG: hypothetical protein H6779_04685 [Candidatus Nomurabacteria bacterium]
MSTIISLNRIKFTALLFVSSFLEVTYVQAAAPGVGATQVTLENPLNVDSIEELLQLILQIVITIATPIVIFFIIYAGFLYVTAKGNAEQTQKATRALTYAIIGGVLIIGAVVIAGIIKNLVLSFQ